MTSVAANEESRNPSAGRLDVLFVITHLQAGGAERVTVLLANELAARGLRVAIAAYVKHGDFIDQVSTRVQLIEVGGAGWAAAILPLARLIRRTRPTAVVGVMVSGNVAAVAAGKLAMTGARIVLVEHNQVDRGAAYYGSLSYRAIRWSYPWAHAIVCVSEGVRDSLCRYAGMTPARMRIIHNPIVPPELAELAGRPCPHPWAGDPEVPLVLAVGRLTPAKDHLMLVRAFALLLRRRRARLLIVGKGPERARIEALIGELGIGEHVAMPGYTDNPYAYMARADLFVLSSQWEGFPTVLVEALACGAPAVATDCPSGPREILLDGDLGSLVPVGDERAFADAMLRALDVAPRRAALMARGNSFTVARAADTYVALLLGEGGVAA